MALGAERRNVLLMILRQGAWQIAAGLALGLGVAALLSRGLGILLFGVRPWDPAVFAAVVLALAAAGTLGVVHPGAAGHAHRAGRGAAARLTRTTARRERSGGVSRPRGRSPAARARRAARSRGCRPAPHAPSARK